MKQLKIQRKNDLDTGIIIIENEQDAILVNGVPKTEDEIAQEREEIKNARQDFQH